MRGGIAERGGVRVGHRIIEINGQSVVATPHEKIVHILSNAVGEVRESRGLGVPLVRSPPPRSPPECPSLSSAHLHTEQSVSDQNLNLVTSGYLRAAPQNPVTSPSAFSSGITCPPPLFSSPIWASSRHSCPSSLHFSQLILPNVPGRF